MRIFHPDTAPRFINRRTGHEIYLTSVIDDQIWAASEEDGTKNFWKPSVFEVEFEKIWDGESARPKALCGLCGFLEIEEDEALCEHCRDRFQ